MGFKPSFDAVATDGMHMLAQSLDHVGVFARELDDVSLIANVLMRKGSMEERFSATDAYPSGRPRVGIVRAPVWSEASDDARSRFDAWTQDRGMSDLVDLGNAFDDAVACQRLILDANLAANLGDACESKPELFEAATRARVQRGRTISANTVRRTLEKIEQQRTRLRQVFQDFDALLTLAAPGEAPLGLSSTGNAVFSAIWTLMGVPAITLPILQGENGLPIGIQVIGAMDADAKLLAIAAHIMNYSKGRQ
jgi:Asp-tRNA(Asn)/Glu-tRNA(Gln) amidotransferase A subunit family amidase